MPVTKVKVNGEWIPAMPVGGGGEGDMTKAVYDTNDDGVVNAADQATKDGSGNVITSTYAAKATTLSGYGITDAKIQNGSIILGSNSITPLTSFTETDPVFTASAAYGISSSDIANWNNKLDSQFAYNESNVAFIDGDVSQYGASINIGAYNSNNNTYLNLGVYDNQIVMYDVQAEVEFIKIEPYVQGNSPTVTIHSLKTPTSNYDAANKLYVDNAIPTIPTNISAFTNDAGYITGYTETDPVFTASAAYGISSSDITNWNGKTSNTGTVTKVTAGTGLKKDSASSGGDITTSGTINHINSVTAQNTQAVYPIKIDSCGHISAYGSAVTITSGTVTSVRVQATSPVNSSTNTAQSTSLNTTISLADAYGDTKNPYSTKTANYVLAGPTSGNASAPSFRALVAADIPTLTASKLSDVSISNGTITIGSNSITPVTSSALADYIASDEIGKVYVSDTEPSNTSNYDIWIDTSTTLQNANGVMV